MKSKLWLTGLIQQQGRFKDFAEGKAFPLRHTIVTGILKS